MAAQKDSCQFSVKNTYAKEDLRNFAKHGPDGRGPKLPSGGLLMLDRIIHIAPDGEGTAAIAEYDVSPSRWFFAEHFEDDPVMPGCLILDGLWQLGGFYLAWRGARGKGRALRGSIQLKQEITPSKAVLQYHLFVSKLRIGRNDAGTIFATGEVRVNDAIIAVVSDVVVHVEPFS